VTTSPHDDGPDRAAEAEVGRRRRQGLAAVKRAARAALVRRSAPWVAVTLLALAACVAGALAWSDATAWIPGPNMMTATEASVTVLPPISTAVAAAAQPVGVAVSGNRLYVVDARRGLVDVLSRDGSHVATIGAGFLKTPAYVAVGPVDGRIYVSDRGRDAVIVYSTTGERLRVLDPAGVDPTSTVPPWRPLALGFAPDGTLYVTDASTRQQVVVFSPSGRRIGAFGPQLPPGRTGQPLSFANGVTATRDSVLVADSNNGRILLLDRAGALTREVPTGGLPRGIAVLEDGRFVVADAALGTLTAYSAEGTQIGQAGLVGDSAGLFAEPSGVAESDDGRIFVADTAKGRVDVLRMAAATPRAASVARRPWTWGLAAALLLAAAVAVAMLAVRSSSRR
jgi:DNA-binding beta-propeller fold protein YncE